MEKENDMTIISHRGLDIDTDKVDYVKPVYRNCLRLYFGDFADPSKDYFIEYDDPDGSLYAALKHKDGSVRP
jgi:hypothetical protein